MRGRAAGGAGGASAEGEDGGTGYSRAVRRIEQEEFARGHVGPADPPVEPRPAATVVLARPSAGSAAHGLEVLLLRRPVEARFAAGAYVFPGGVIDPADRDPGLADLFGAPRREGAEETAALAAGVRELFEETGILPADRRPPEPATRRAREELLADRTTLRRIAAELDVSFRALEAVYFARWITPELLARRYDTRFFLAVPGGGAWPEPRLTAEHTTWLWIGPREAVERFHAGGLPMLFPTWKTLEQLGRFESLEEALEALRSRPVEPVRPRLVLEEGGRVRPVMPGDPGYERGR